jgi:uncharacterized spore protein YtfJ
MNTSDTAVLDSIRDAIGKAGASHAFGEPVSRDGVTVVPAAKVSGGGGGGSGEGNQPGREGKPTDRSGRGVGGGFGVTSTPVGAFVIKDGTVRWRPAVDANKIILGAQIVAITALLTVRAVVRARSRRAARGSRPVRIALRMLNRRYLTD